MCTHISWSLRFHDRQSEANFWKESSDKVLVKLDWIWFVLGYLKTLKASEYEIIWPGFVLWGQVLFVTAMFQVGWATFHYTSYLRNRNKINAMQRAIRLAMVFDLARRTQVTELAIGIGQKWGAQSSTLVVVKVILLISGTAHFLDHALSKQLPFIQTAVFQTLSVVLALGGGMHTLTRVLSLPEYHDGTRRVCSFIETCVGDVLAVGTGTGIVLQSDLCNKKSAASAAFLSITSSQLFLGLFVPLYACYHVEHICKARFLERHGLHCQGKHGWGMMGWSGTIVGLVYHSMFIATLFCLSWFLAEVALAWYV